MLGQFLDSRVQMENTPYQPKLLKSKADISLFNDVLSDLKILDAQKEAVVEETTSEIHITFKL